MKNGQNCTTCLFGRTVTEHTAIVCVRYPPSVFPVQKQNPISGRSQFGSMVAFPTVGSDTWCGEYRSKISVATRDPGDA